MSDLVLYLYYLPAGFNLVVCLAVLWALHTGKVERKHIEGGDFFSVGVLVLIPVINILFTIFVFFTVLRLFITRIADLCSK